MTLKTAIIGGSGFDQLEGFKVLSLGSLQTPYGEASSVPMVGYLNDHKIYFLPRHGANHHLPPHKINYRANLYYLHQLGIKEVIAIAAVGGISKPHIETEISIPHQIIDYTSGRAHTYFDGEEYAGSILPNQVQHVVFTEPYTASMRSKLIAAAHASDVDTVENAVYGVTQGPRFESVSEIAKMEKEGVNLVGMTGMPEAALAAELGMHYACISMTVNPAAGKGEALTMKLIMENLVRCRRLVLKILNHYHFEET